MQILCFHRNSGPPHFFVNFGQYFFVSAEINLILDFFNERYPLQCVNDVHLPNGRVRYNVLNCEGIPVQTLNIFNNFLRPEGKIRLSPQIGQWLFWSTHSFLYFTQLIAHVDQQFAIAFSLVEGQREDAAQIITLLEVLVFTEVAHYVVPAVILFG